MSEYLEKTREGARIIIDDWVKIRPTNRLLIVSSEKYMMEANLLKEMALVRNAYVDIMVVETSGIHVGIFFDENEDIFNNYDIIIGATDYSLVTTQAAKKAIERGGKFLSLPLSVNNGKSMLSFEFIRMYTKKSKMIANLVMDYIKNSTIIRVETDLGTNLKFYKENRDTGFFNGVVNDGGGYSSASFEIYIPIEETKTEGIMIVDGSLGYIGRPESPIEIEISKGKIIGIEKNNSGTKLKKYIENYNDKGMYVASELGIGLNSYSKCEGNCYIEDESAYGTFHIGFGRNIALGGVHEANGHFDLVSLLPDIYVDNKMIMDKGRIILPEFQLF